MRAPVPDAVGARRQNRRLEQLARRAGWVRPLLRAAAALDTTMRLIDRTQRTIASSERCAHRRPIRASKKLQGASERLMAATQKLGCAWRKLGQVNECAIREPERSGAVPGLLLDATEMWVHTAERLRDTADQLFDLHADVLDGIVSGELVPEQEPERAPRRPRIIILKPRPMPIRAFLAVRPRRVAERISPLLQRRRRILRPAAIRVPRRTLLGRAPPVSSTCAL
jgi:hypothetical protein